MAKIARPPVSCINVTLTLVTLLLFTSTLQVQSTSSSNSSQHSSQAPEWFENCDLHSIYTNDPSDVLVDQKPFTSFCGPFFQKETTEFCNPVLRCWENNTRALAYPNTTNDNPFSNITSHVFPPEASPWLLQALKSLINKGHVKPFSLFEVHSRVYGKMKPWPSRNYTEAQMDLLSFVRSHYGDSVTEDLDRNGLSLQCRDYDCDLNSKEYWYHLFYVFKRQRWLPREVYGGRNRFIPTTRRIDCPKLYKYGIPIPYRPPPLHL